MGDMDAVFLGRVKNCSRKKNGLCFKFGRWSCVASCDEEIQSNWRHIKIHNVDLPKKIKKKESKTCLSDRRSGGVKVRVMGIWWPKEKDATENGGKNGEAWGKGENGARLSFFFFCLIAYHDQNQFPQTSNFKDSFFNRKLKIYFQSHSDSYEATHRS